MKKIKNIVFLLLGAVVHFGLMFLVVISRFSCGIKMGCISLPNEIAGAILSFPLGLIVWVMQSLGLDPYAVINLPQKYDLFAIFAVNSILAVTFFWYVLVKPFLQWRKEDRE